MPESTEGIEAGRLVSGNGHGGADPRSPHKLIAAGAERKCKRQEQHNEDGELHNSFRRNAIHMINDLSLFAFLEYEIMLVCLQIRGRAH